MSDRVGEDDNTTPENKSSDTSSTVPDPSRTGAIDKNMTKNKDKSQPKAVDAGSSEIRKDDNTSENKSSDTSSTVPAPGSMDSSTNKDQIELKAVDAGSSELTDSVGEDDNATTENKSSDTSSTVPAPSETGSFKEVSINNTAEVGQGQQSVKISEKISPEKERSREFNELLCRLHLKDNYLDKLTTADILQIGSSIKKPNEITEKDLVHAFLQKLLMLDHRARYIPVENNVKVTQDSDKGSREESFFDVFDRTNVNTDQSMKQCHINPMDVQMAVFHCSDSFLRQDMITKLSQCQYALPLLVPDPVTMDIQCPLWTYRQIRKTWKVTDMHSGTKTNKDLPICQAETPMVSFLRFGSVSSSKSQLMNTLINNRHSTFFHRNCSGATKSHCLIDGMAEIAWYCPAGKPNDAFSDCVAFCNLHGDALTHDKQRAILIDKASVNVVLLPTLRRDDTMVAELVKGPKPLICLLADNDSVAKEIKPGKFIMGVKDRSQSNVAEEMTRVIRNILSTTNTSFQLQSMGNVSEIKTDEEDPACQKGKFAAQQILNLLKGKELSEIKGTFLPCHGQLWHEWCKVKKDLSCLKVDSCGAQSLEMKKSEKLMKLKQIRQKQCDKPSSELMQMFIENLQSLDENEKLYFLKWIVFFLDDSFSDKLSELNQAYDAKWSEVLHLKKNNGNSDMLKKKQHELGEISDELQSSTVGFEHILRETGQLYEASIEASTSKRGYWSHYPKLAAELMIAGHPMELMDGDAAHVPLTWITSVLDEVKNKLGDEKRVFVLSVLGIQSSGKSTMLNAMFGLKFAVSSGRCTRGAFMQLVNVSKEIQEDFKFDYVLVVDTEGLRAPELAGQDTYRHDNELATFVIGLGNMTLINIFGENLSEMQDILHIAVQAFMRMKKVKLSPSCVFVHQNVAAIEAGEKNKVGKRRLQENLDEMTKLAAKEEAFDAKFFSDVIAFDVDKDVKYISQLWEGNPPMAPPNPGYSENIQELKNLILSKAKQSKGMKLSEFNSTIKDLWDALLNENFVFSFKNTMEISLYRKLEEEYAKWTWALRQGMRTIENQLHHRIDNGRLDKINKSDLVKDMNKTWEEVEKAVKEYFEEDKDVLVQWKTQFEKKIKAFRDEQVTGAKQKLEEIIQQRKARKNWDDRKTFYENELLHKSKELASKLKGKANDETELEKEFNTLWKGWVTDLTADVPPIMEINIQEDVYSILQDMGYEWSLIASRKSSKDISKQGDYTDCIANMHNTSSTGEVFTKAFKKVASWFSSTSSTKEINPNDLLKALIAKVETQTNVLIKEKPVDTGGYHNSYMQEVAKNVEEQLKDFESLIGLKKEFRLDLLLNACKIAMAYFQNAHNEFQKINDARAYLENQKGQFYNVFSSFCRGSSSAAVLAELLCSKLKVSAVQPIYDKSALALAGEIRCSHPPFSANRVNLEKHVLQSLAKDEDFDSYINYIRHPRKHVELFIKTSVEEYISNNQNKVLNIMKKNVEDIVGLLKQAVHDVTEIVKKQSGDTSMWLKEFSSLLKDDLRVATDCYDHLKDINKFDFLKEQIENHLNKDLKSMEADLNSLLTNKEDVRLKTVCVSILIDQLCKCCWVQCPFCCAICTNTVEDHSPDDHSVPFHSPRAVSGGSYRGTKLFVTDFCTTLVASDVHFFPKKKSDETIPFKEYRKKYPDWRITPDESKLTYWKWFVCHFEKQLEDYYGKTFEGIGEIPEEWKEHTKQEAIESLENM